MVLLETHRGSSGAIDADAGVAVVSGADGRARTAVALLVGFGAIQILSGLESGSLMLLGDALGILLGAGMAVMGTSRFGSGVSKAGSRPMAKRFILIAIGLLFIVVSGCLIYEAYRRARHPPPIPADFVMLAAFGSMAVRSIGHFLVRGIGLSGEHRQAEDIRLMSELIAPLQVLIAALAIEISGWPQLDIIVAAALGLYVALEACGFLVER